MTPEERLARLLLLHHLVTVTGKSPDEIIGHLENSFKGATTRVPDTRDEDIANGITQNYEGASRDWVMPGELDQSEPKDTNMKIKEEFDRSTRTTKGRGVKKP